jgi:hypothetical protein
VEAETAPTVEKERTRAAVAKEKPSAEVGDALLLHAGEILGLGHRKKTGNAVFFLLPRLALRADCVLPPRIKLAQFAARGKPAAFRGQFLRRAAVAALDGDARADGSGVARPSFLPSGCIRAPVLAPLFLAAFARECLPPGILEPRFRHRQRDGRVHAPRWLDPSTLPRCKACAA